MQSFEEEKFNIPKLKGISEKNVEEHLKLYAGYVKNSNLILQKIEELSKDSDTDSYAISELQRRFGFEFDGMRNHEYYFSFFEGGPKEISKDSELYKSTTYLWGSFDTWLARFKSIAMTRGVGWAVLYFDKQNQMLLNTWVDEHHLGHLTGLTPILMIDMWEHAFVADYQPSGKKQYIEDFFSNLNWKKVEENLDKAI